MKPVFLSWLLLAAIVGGIGAGAGIGTASAQAQAAPALEGRWSGTLGKGSDQRRVVVEFHRASDGRLAGSVTGLDQGDSALAVDAIEQSGAAVKLVVGAIGGGFEGSLSSDGSTLTGTWSEIAITTPLELARLPASP